MAPEFRLRESLPTENWLLKFLLSPETAALYPTPAFLVEPTIELFHPMARPVIRDIVGRLPQRLIDFVRTVRFIPQRQIGGLGQYAPLNPKFPAESAIRPAIDIAEEVPWYLQPYVFGHEVGHAGHELLYPKTFPEAFWSEARPVYEVPAAEQLARALGVKLSGISPELYTMKLGRPYPSPEWLRHAENILAELLRNGP